MQNVTTHTWWRLLLHNKFVRRRKFRWAAGLLFKMKAVQFEPESSCGSPGCPQGSVVYMKSGFCLRLFCRYEQLQLFFFFLTSFFSLELISDFILAVGSNRAPIRWTTELMKSLSLHLFVLLLLLLFLFPCSIYPSAQGDTRSGFSHCGGVSSLTKLNMCN